MSRLLLLIGVLFSFSGFSQVSFHMSFDGDMDKYYPKSDKEEAVYVTQVQRPQWVDGFKGKALDLSENAVLRRPMIIDSLETPDFGKDISFTVKCWVKTIKGAQQGTAVMGNKPDGAAKQPGWIIFSQESGAWGVNLSDGKTVVSYSPHVPRQAINDGKWHQLAFCVDRKKQEVWFYFDGVNVGIYNTSGLGSLNSHHRLVVGGTDQYWEYGSMGQWTAFNGYLDEVSIDKCQTSKEIKDDYAHFYPVSEPDKLVAPLRTMVWNIWHGGRRYGKHVGVKRLVETIKMAQPDVIGLIETYGSGEIIADSLGYYYCLISSNLSIMSRFPIVETIKAFRPFNFGGVILDLGEGRQLAFMDTWLHYLPDYGKSITNGKMTSKELVKAEKKTRHSEIKQILKEVSPILKNRGEMPVIMLGDFNGGSHLDWGEETRKIHYDYNVPWPVSIEMKNAGFKDSYRELHINPLLDPGFTWTPRAATSSTHYGLRDRIDFIYYMGNIDPVESKVIDYHPIMFPSDHAAVMTVFEFK